MKPPINHLDHLRLQLQAIKSATNNFSNQHCIGKGGFGSVYKGELLHSMGWTAVAIKRLNREFGQGEPEFWKEIITLSLYRNENIVSLLGFCDESEEKILVYEYVSRKSLDLYLNSDDLSWVRRLKICIGAARGLAYLHRPNDAHQRVLHRDIKSGNILLDQDWNARISDFGLSKFGPADQLHTFLISNPAGTPWYVDPLYVQAGLLTKESDVYSFGVVLFEVLCGRLCYPNDTNCKQPLIELVQQFYDQNKIEEIIFDKIKGEINPSSLKTFATIAYRCLNLNREARPRMTEVVSVLETALYYQESIQTPPISLRDISPGGAAEPIEVRVVRRWIPSETEIECCYLFVDRNGDAIQVVADLRDLQHFNAIITLHSCYRVTNYICENCRYIGKIAPHCASIRIGKAATFIQILDDGFPSHYFNFVTYENLRARLNKRQLLTDYVGKVESITDTETLIQSNKDCLKIKLLEDPSGGVVEATLLGEVATSFDKDALMHAPSPVIAALTSMEVVENEGALQLTPTSATHVYLDPNIEQAKSIAAKFQGGNMTIKCNMFDNKDNESERNRATLAELLEKVPKHHTGTRFTCIASITKIDKRRSWYYKGCTECLKKLKPRGHIMACLDHGDISEPRYMYCVNVTIKDHTTSASAIFFDGAMTSLLQTECVNMVVDQGYTDPNIIPEPLHSIKGQTRIFQLELAKPGYKSSARFIVNQVFQTTLPTPIPTPATPLTRVKRKLLRSQDDDAAKKVKPKKNKRIVKRRKN